MDKKNKPVRTKRSISRQFVVSVILIVVILVSVITVTTASLMSKFYENQIQIEIKNTSEFIEKNVSTFINGAYNLSYELAVNQDILTLDGKIQTPILENAVIRNDYFELLYTQGLDGMQTARSSGEVGDRASRWWFIKMMEDPQPFVSESYYSVGTKMPCTSIFLPMYNGTELSGVFGADIRLGYIQQLIEQFAEYDRGRYSFIIDGAGVVMAHPDNVYLETLVNYKTLTQTVSQKDADGNVVMDADGNVLTQEEALEISESFKAVMEMVMDGKDGVAAVEIDGAKYSVGYTPIPLPGHSDSWAVLTLQDRTVVSGIVARLIRNMIIVALIITVFAVFMLIVMARRITAPLTQMATTAHKFAGGNMDVRVNYQKEDEIGLLANAFNKMADEIIKNMEALKAATIEKERVESELRIASKIQNDMLPDVDESFCNVPLADVHALVHPALEMGGDLYDTFFIDEEKQKLCLVVADVSGKGVPAAMFMVVARTLIRNYTLAKYDPAVVLQKANEYLCMDNPDSMFVTMFLATIDLSCGKCQYSHAGHNPIAYCPKGGAFSFVELEKTMPLGFFPGHEYPLYETEIAVGDRVFMYTDGVTEALDKDDTEWGDDTLINSLNSYLDCSCEEIMQRVREDIRKHAKDCPQSDDITILVAKLMEPK